MHFCKEIVMDKLTLDANLSKLNVLFRLFALWKRWMVLHKNLQNWTKKRHEMTNKGFEISFLCYFPYLKKITMVYIIGKFGPE